MDEDPRKLSRNAVAIRLGAIGAAVVCMACGFAYVGGWFTPGRLTQGKVIDGFEAVNGKHVGFRRNHAKGLCATGWFDSNGAGVPFSKADVLAPGVCLSLHALPSQAACRSSRTPRIWCAAWRCS